jgi:hypothetical protein
MLNKPSEKKNNEILRLLQYHFINYERFGCFSFTTKRMAKLKK